MNNTDNWYKSSNFSFIASCILSNITTAVRAFRNPENPKQTIFALKPKDKVQELFQAYLQDDLKFSPRQLAETISTIKQMPLTTEVEFSNEKNRTGVIDGVA